MFCHIINNLFTTWKKWNNSNGWDAELPLYEFNLFSWLLLALKNSSKYMIAAIIVFFKWLFMLFRQIEWDNTSSYWNATEEYLWLVTIWRDYQFRFNSIPNKSDSNGKFQNGVELKLEVRSILNKIKKTFRLPEKVFQILVCILQKSLQFYEFGHVFCVFLWTLPKIYEKTKSIGAI